MPYRATDDLSFIALIVERVCCYPHPVPNLKNRGHAMIASVRTSTKLSKLRRLFSFYILSVLIQAWGPHSTAEAGDLTKGKELAEKVCGICHGVAAPLEVDGEKILTFTEIANSKNYSTVRLRTMMAIPAHRQMPTPFLTQQESDDVVAFIESLRKRRP
jgi:Cytochrome c